MQDQLTFSIGAAARRIGISTHALRKWEDRHGAIQPSRSAGGDRRYSGGDIDRLTKLKSLVDLGHAISALAPLADDQLEHLLKDVPAPRRLERRPVVVAVIGERLGYELNRAMSRLPDAVVAAQATTADALTDKLAQLATDVIVDVIVIELGSLGSDTVSELEQVRATTDVQRVAIVYGYGSIEAAERLADARTALVRRPINHYEFSRTLSALSGVPVSEQPVLGLPPHRFSRDVLARMATISPELACECPQHVGQLLIELSDFENYSAECEDTKPQDAAIHNMLRRTAATSRALFERALIELAEAEGIDLNGVASDSRLVTPR